jgi:hypothetical protein
MFNQTNDSKCAYWRLAVRCNSKDMLEIIKELNHTSALRTIFYCVVLIIIVAILASCIKVIVKSIFKSLPGKQ